MTQLNRRLQNPEHVPAQNSDVIEIPLASGETEYLWAADLWFSAKSGLKGRDHQYWEPLRFVEKDINLHDGGQSVKVKVPVPARSRRDGQWVDCFTLDLALPTRIQREDSGTLNPCRHVSVVDGGKTNADL